MNNKYFTPITELPGDSGKSESAAAMAQYARSTSPHKYENKSTKKLKDNEYFQKIMTVEQSYNDLFTPLSQQQQIKKSALHTQSNKYANSFSNKYAPQKSTTIQKSMSSKSTSIKKSKGKEIDIDGLLKIIVEALKNAGSILPTAKMSDMNPVIRNFQNELKDMLEGQSSGQSASSHFTIPSDQLMQRVINYVEKEASNPSLSDEARTQYLNLLNSISEPSSSGRKPTRYGGAIQYKIFEPAYDSTTNPRYTEFFSTPAETARRLQTEYQRRGLPAKQDTWAERWIHRLAPPEFPDEGGKSASFLDKLLIGHKNTWGPSAFGLDYLPRLIHNRQATGGTGLIDFFRNPMTPQAYKNRLLRALGDAGFAPSFIGRQNVMSPQSERNKLVELGLIPETATASDYRRMLEDRIDQSLGRATFADDETSTAFLRNLPKAIDSIYQPGYSETARPQRQKSIIQNVNDRLKQSMNADVVPTDRALSNLIWRGLLGGSGLASVGAGVIDYFKNPIGITRNVIGTVRGTRGNTSAPPRNTSAPAAPAAPKPPASSSSKNTFTNSDLGNALFDN